ncbi:hypothetical protein QTN25_005244 [Entamoeba marina]
MVALLFCFISCLWVVFGDCTTSNDLFHDPLFPSHKFYVVYCGFSLDQFSFVCDSTSYDTTTIKTSSSTTSIIIPLGSIASNNCSETVLSPLSIDLTRCHISTSSTKYSISILKQGTFSDVDDYLSYFTTAYQDFINEDSRNILDTILYINYYVPANVRVAEERFTLSQNTPNTTTTKYFTYIYCHEPHYIKTGTTTTFNSDFSSTNGCPVDSTNDTFCGPLTNGKIRNESKEFIHYNTSSYENEMRFLAETWLNEYDTEIYKPDCFDNETVVDESLTVLDIASTYFNCIINELQSSVDCLSTYRSNMSSCITYYDESPETITITELESIPPSELTSSFVFFPPKTKSIITDLSIYFKGYTQISTINITFEPYKNSKNVPELYCQWFPIVDGNRTHNTYLGADSIQISIEKLNDNAYCTICMNTPYKNSEWNNNSTYIQSTFFLYESEPCNLKRKDSTTNGSGISNGLLGDVACINISESGKYYLGATVDIRVPQKTNTTGIIVISVFVVILGIIVVVMLIALVHYWILDQRVYRKNKSEEKQQAKMLLEKEKEEQEQELEQQNQEVLDDSNPNETKTMENKTNFAFVDSIEETKQLNPAELETESITSSMTTMTNDTF